MSERTDTERLDWMVEHEARVHGFGGPGEVNYECDWWDPKCSRMRLRDGSSSRAAIDAAMDAEAE